MTKPDSISFNTKFKHQLQKFLSSGSFYDVNIACEFWDEYAGIFVGLEDLCEDLCVMMETTIRDALWSPRVVILNEN